MPSGWAVDTSGIFDDDGDSTDECENGQPSPTGIELDDFPQANRTFTAGAFDFVSEHIARLTDDDLVGQALDQMRTAIADCPTLISDDGTTTTLSEMSFPGFGDDSIALLAKPDSIPITAVFVIVGVNDTVMFIIGVGDGADVELLEDLTEAAVDRIG